MSESGKKIVTALVVLVIFVISMALLVTGQRNVGAKGLLTMLVGLAGLIGLLGFYNSKYK